MESQRLTADAVERIFRLFQKAEYRNDHPGH